MVSIRWVGVMLINSLLILPAAASRNVARSAAGYMRTSVIIALCCGVVGLALSYYLNTSAGAAIVLCCAGSVLRDPADAQKITLKTDISAHIACLRRLLCYNPARHKKAEGSETSGFWFGVPPA